jgi:hypothetical protein
MVDKGGGAVADGIHQAHQGGVAHTVHIQRAVQLPPQFLQNLHEAAGWAAGDGHTAREGAIKVSVGANVAGQD